MQPFKCPVCGGCGTVPFGFYRNGVTDSSGSSTSTEPEKCKSCGGTGVLWGAAPSPPWWWYRPMWEPVKPWSDATSTIFTNDTVSAVNSLAGAGEPEGTSCLTITLE